MFGVGVVSPLKFSTTTQTFASRPPEPPGTAML